MGLIAYRFRYIGSRSSDTFPLYAKHIRGFLRVHRTSAVWIQGGKVGKEAYMILGSDFTAGRFTLMMERVQDWMVYPVHATALIKHVEEAERITKGYLRYEDVEIGDSDETFCPEKKWSPVSISTQCEKGGYENKCAFWNGRRCTWKSWQPRKIVKRIECANRLTREDAEEYIAMKKKQGSTSKYEIEQRTDSPTGDTYYRIYQVSVSYG